jgi:hypothetical protein
VIPYAVCHQRPKLGPRFGRTQCDLCYMYATAAL